MRLPQPLMASLKRLNNVLSLLLRQVPRELNDAASVRTVGKIAGRELVQRLRQAQRVLDLLNARRTLHRAGLTHLRDVKHLVARQHRLAVNHKFAAPRRRVTAHRDPCRVKRLQRDNVTVATTNDLNDRAMRQQHRHNDLLVILHARRTRTLRLVHPRRPRPERKPIPVTTNKRVNRQARDRVRQQPSAGIHRADLRRIVDADRRTCPRLQRRHVQPSTPNLLVGQVTRLNLLTAKKPSKH